MWAPALTIVLLTAACTTHTTPNAGGGGPTPTVSSKVKLVDALNVSCPAPVTPTCVTVGNVSTISGIIPGLFEGAAVGTDAYFSYLDSTQGGINGRKIALISEDDKFNGQNNSAETQSIIAKVIAFVGSFSLDDQDGGLILAKHPTIPNVSLSLSQSTLDLPNTVSPDPAIGGWQLGPLEYFAQQYPTAIKHVGLLIAQESSAEAQALGLEGAMKHLGYKITYSTLFGPLDTQFQTQILAMQHAGVQFVDLTIMDAADAEHIVSEMNTQGYHPEVIESAGPIYVDNFVQLAGGAVECGRDLPGSDERALPRWRLEVGAGGQHVLVLGPEGAPRVHPRSVHALRMDIGHALRTGPRERGSGPDIGGAPAISEADPLVQRERDDRHVGPRWAPAAIVLAPCENRERRVRAHPAFAEGRVHLQRALLRRLIPVPAVRTADTRPGRKDG